MRTLSARILLGFIALTITFGVFAATIVVNLREVEDEASLMASVSHLVDSYMAARFCLASSGAALHM